MTKSEGSREHRHPDAVDCPEGLPEDEAAVHCRWSAGTRTGSPDAGSRGGGGARCGAATSRGTARRMRFRRRSRRSSGRCCRGWRRTWARGFRTWTGAGARSGTPRRAAGRDAAGAGVRGLRQADGPARDAEEGLAHAARPGRGGAHAFPLPVVRQGVLPAGPGAGAGERHRRDGAADGLRGGEPARRQPRQARCSARPDRRRPVRRPVTASDRQRGGAVRRPPFVSGLFHCLERASDPARRSCRRERSGTGGSGCAMNLRLTPVHAASRARARRRPSNPVDIITIIAVCVLRTHTAIIHGYLPSHVLRT